MHTTVNGLNQNLVLTLGYMQCKREFYGGTNLSAVSNQNNYFVFFACAHAFAMPSVGLIMSWKKL